MRDGLLNTVGDIIWRSMKRELSTKVGKDFRNWENDGEIDYQTKVKMTSQEGEKVD